MPAPADDAPVLAVRDLSVGRLAGISFDMRPGEVVGIAGLLGSGRSTLLRTLFGEQAVVSGSISLAGRPAGFRHAGDAMRSGIGFVPEDRGAEAAFLDLTVQDNLLLASTSEFFVKGRMRRRRERREASELIQRFGVKARSVRAPLSTLSGGNQQKVIIARWLRRQPRLLLLDEPTQGVDVGARADIYAMVRSAAGQGAAVLLVVSDFEELAQVCDRVLVLRDGRLVKDVSSAQVTVNHITDLAYAG
jgi:ribose transport system ATP-binding protein